MCKIAEKYQYARRAGCAYAHNFREYPGCALIGACALIRTNTVTMMLKCHLSVEIVDIWCLIIQCNFWLRIIRYLYVKLV